MRENTGVLMLQRWWRSLESLFGLAGVTSQWKSLLGPDYDVMKGYLRPNGQFAMTLPCRARNGCGCQHRVVEHSPDNIVAVCQCEPQRCDTFSITRADMAIYEVNLDQFCRDLDIALQVDPVGNRVSDMHMTFQVGKYSPMAGFNFPLILTMQVDQYDLQQVVGGLIADCRGPFVLLIPTLDLCTKSVTGMIRKNECAVLPLDKIIGLDDEGQFATVQPLDVLLSGFRETHLPPTGDEPQMTFFSTPSDSTWENVNLKFVDGHRVSVKVKFERGLFNYTQMGMANSKNGEPTVQWDLLRAFAEERGELTWGSRKADANNKKRKGNLARDLSRFFRIDGDPFVYDETIKGWRSRFHIEPE